MKTKKPYGDLDLATRTLNLPGLWHEGKLSRIVRWVLRFRKTYYAVAVDSRRTITVKVKRLFGVNYVWAWSVCGHNLYTTSPIMV